jgi:cell division protein FtsL
MAVATKAATAATKTEYQQQIASPIYRRRRKQRNAVVTQLIIGIVGLLGLLGYIGLYAQVTLYGYQRAELSRQTRQAEMQNQELKAEIQTLSSPERLAVAAKNAGMVPSTRVVYIPGSSKVRVAKAE